MGIIHVRDEIENVVKELNIDRARFFEVPKLKYEGIIRKIEEKFVRYDHSSIHWANMGNYAPELRKEVRDVSSNCLWYHHLPEIVPDGDKPVYFLAEGFNYKYWLYEAYLPELCCVLDELGYFDFYIISKKFGWLVSENHHSLADFVGKGLDLACFPDFHV